MHFQTVSHLTKLSCLRFHNVRVQVESSRRHSPEWDLPEEMFRVVAPVDLVIATLEVSPSRQQVTPKPLCTVSMAPLFSVKQGDIVRTKIRVKYHDDGKIRRLYGLRCLTVQHGYQQKQDIRVHKTVLTLGSVFAFVVNLCTRHTLLNIAPKASVNPVDRIQARA